ncbi:sulfite exporter TauE/SafE family protein [Sandaracinobacter sp. RS1-74]|uniref:sulfite exporter TauE/SafE family protein n=1 Tax=Sandaracinobacteroides sayramensis TaxID=2913411 RepID=UPI001EDAF6D4|nr:sulfite exporter TauE/SafE family protein [Sandaracinobacteroides sayramensis]MCG2842595.1 sulfite exporter TauE/SafE family protein [Sandaracinobacteroides sayramensis]
MLLAGLLSGFAAGMFGIGGGFIVVPALLIVLPLLGGAPEHLAHLAIGTSLATIIPTSLRSMQAHARRGAVDFDILRSWAPWIALGAVFGAWLASRLSGDVLLVIFGIGVILMSVHFLTSLTRALHRPTGAMPVGLARVGIVSGLGTLSALLGIGGGTIAVIVMTLCGRSLHRAIATASGLGVVVAVPGATGFLIAGLGLKGLPFGSTGYVNLPAAVVIVAASFVTAPLGVAAVHGLKPERLRPIFGVYLVVIGLVMIHRGFSA